jgi:hypothetical protein
MGPQPKTLNPETRNPETRNPETRNPETRNAEDEYGDGSYNGSWHELKFYERDYMANSINNTFSFMVPDPVIQQQLRNKKTHMLSVRFRV